MSMKAKAYFTVVGAFEIPYKLMWDKILQRWGDPLGILGKRKRKSFW